MPFKQIAALPVRRNAKGKLKILLVTSRQTGRWIVPKGWRSKRLKDPDAAAREAKEEAGVSGKVSRKPLGSFLYFKRQTDGFHEVKVAVYLFKVSKVRKQWEEADQRKRKWLSSREAALLVQEPALVTLIKQLKRATRIKSTPKRKDAIRRRTE